MKRAHTDDHVDKTDRMSRRERVQWDEANLEENDRIKDELRPRKCDEPKTPYHGPLDTDEELSLEEAGMSPLALDEEEEVTQARPEHARHPNGSVPLQEVVDSLPEPNGEQYIDRSRQPSLESGSSGENAKKQRFQEQRKKHYKMRDALERGKQLTQTDSDNQRNRNQYGNHSNGLAHHSASAERC